MDARLRESDWAFLRGAAAFACDKRLADNPYPRKSRERRAWRRGFTRLRSSPLPWPKDHRPGKSYVPVKGSPSAVVLTQARDTVLRVSRLTKKPENRPRKKHPGRGRSILGPRREWSADDVDVLRCNPNLPDDVLAEHLNRSPAAVKTKRSKLKHEGAKA